MKVAITGATGFIGSALCRYLGERGHDVLGLARSVERSESLGRAGIAVGVADVTDRSALQQALAGCDAVIHTAALFNRPEASWDQFREVNVVGTRNVLEAARANGLRRAVHTSTVGVAMGSTSPPYDERAPYGPPPSDKYEVTKCEGERGALAFHRETGFPVVVLRPAQVYGPGDRSKAKFYRLVQKGVIVNEGATFKHLVYIDDLCRAFELALTSERAVGEVVIVAGPEPAPLRELVRLVADDLGVAPPRVRLPATPVVLACAAVEAACNLARVKPVLFRRSMDFFTRSAVFGTDKAREVLGFEAECGVRTGVRNTVAWYREQGLLGGAEPAAASVRRSAAVTDA